MRELYGSLNALVGNYEWLLNLDQAKTMIAKLEDFIVEILPKVSAEEVYLFAFYALRQNVLPTKKLAEHIYGSILSQITEQG